MFTLIGILAVIGALVFFVFAAVIEYLVTSWVGVFKMFVSFAAFILVVLAVVLVWAFGG